MVIQSLDIFYIATKKKRPIMIQKLEQEFLVLVHDQQKNISKRTFFFFYWHCPFLVFFIREQMVPYLR